MKKIISFIANLIKTDTQESSKRFIALFTMLIIAVIVFIYTNGNNLIMVLDALLLFVLTLLGLAVWQRIKLNQKNKDENI